MQKQPPPLPPPASTWGGHTSGSHFPPCPCRVCSCFERPGNPDSPHPGGCCPGPRGAGEAGDQPSLWQGAGHRPSSPSILPPCLGLGCRSPPAGGVPRVGASPPFTGVSITRRLRILLSCCSEMWRQLLRDTETSASGPQGKKEEKKKRDRERERQGRARRRRGGRRWGKTCSHLQARQQPWPWLREPLAQRGGLGGEGGCPRDPPPPHN